MPWDGPKTCEYLMAEAERLLDEGQADAGRLIFNRVAETCLVGRHPCPRGGPCRIAAERVARRLDVRLETSGSQAGPGDAYWV
ncbi:hypothetical protein CKO28_10830 [Rhodovibrio sodomensis]|uniref:Uncharacterized protein n=1 Tax=Rhodovibrio sodomensis TaxID=1088 RepID=A0ABS1DF07_9PROT|nr:hypothetical protein [Rhodovibrio sodomensis]MBK1668526.1 hypothetical protein [Rhodovibrio sodomensis]